MALMQETLFGTVDKVQIAIDRLRAFEPADGYWLAFSGGKDSVVIKRLAQMAGVKFESHYSVTSVDPPELVRFIKAVHPDVHFDIPRDRECKAITMWNLIPRKQIPPLRTKRYCCVALKEVAGKGRVTITGVRWAESVNRRNNRNLVDIGSLKSGISYRDDNEDARRAVEQCYRTRSTVVNPIIDWMTEDVWEFIKAEKVQYCELYDCGYKRLGCIGCPMNTTAAAELEAYPKYRDAYLRAFARMIEVREAAGKNEPPTFFTSPEATMDWWLHGGTDADEITLLDDLRTEDD